MTKQEHVDPTLDTNTNADDKAKTVKIPDDFMNGIEKDTDEYETKAEEWRTLGDAGQANWKLENQSRHAQSKITQINNQHYENLKFLADGNDNVIEKLANGSDKEIKMAKRLAQDIHGKTLNEFLEKEDEDLTPIQLREQAKREVMIDISKENFIRDNDVINPSSANYKEEVAQKFNQMVRKLGDDDIQTLSEVTETHNEALKIAIALLPEVEQKEAVLQATKQTASAGGGRIVKKSLPTTGDPLDGIPKSKW